MTAVAAPLRLGAADVLVLRALGLGDALTGIPALRGLRRTFPDRRLVLAGPEAIGWWLKDLGIIDVLVPATGLTPLRVEGTGHLAVDLHGRGPQSRVVVAETGPDQVLAFASPGAPAWRLDEHEVDRWCRLVRAVGVQAGREDLRLPRRTVSNGQVLVHPGAASAARRWPAGRWARVVQRLTANGATVVLTGGPQEHDLCADIARAAPSSRVRNVAGTLTVPALAELVAAAAMVVCGDTGVAHLATAYATPSILLFGPTPPRWWGPAIDPEIHTVLWPAPPDYRGDPHGSLIDPVLAGISVTDVNDAVDRRFR